MGLAGKIAYGVKKILKGKGFNVEPNRINNKDDKSDNGNYVATTSGWKETSTTTPTTPKPNNNSGGGSVYIPIDVVNENTKQVTPSPNINNINSDNTIINQNNQAMRLLLTGNRIKELQKGSGALRDYQFNARLQNNLRDIQENRKKYYQDEYNKGRISYEEANKGLNRDINSYLKKEYEGEGYKVKETNEGFNIEREVPDYKGIFQKDIFGNTEIINPKYKDSEYKEGNIIFKSIEYIKEKTKPPEKPNNPEWLENYNEKNKVVNKNPSKPFAFWLGEKIENSALGKKLLNKYPFLSTGEINEKYNVTYKNPFSKEQTTQEINVKSKILDVQKTNIFFSNLGKGVLFTPIMATGTQAILESPIQEGVYEYFIRNGIRYRKNKLTGQIEKEILSFDVSLANQEKPLSVPTINEKGALGRYKIKFGGKEYYVTEQGKLIRINENNQLVTDLKLNQVQNYNPIQIKQTEIIKPLTPKVDSLPSMVGGEGLKVIPRNPNKLTGQNILEINLNRLPNNMQYAGSLTGSLGSNQLNILSSSNLLSNKSNNLFIEKSKLALEEKSVSKNKNKLVSMFNNLEVQSNIPQQKEQSILKEMSKQSLINLQALRLKSKLKNIQKSKQVQKQTQKINKPTIEKLKFKFKLPLNIKKEKSNNEFGVFEAKAFKLGKEITIAKGSKEKVSKELKDFLKSELSASGYLETGGKKLKAEDTGLLNDFEFRKSKVKPYLVVEEKSKRLRKGSTGKEIQYFKKKSGGKLF